MRARTSMGRAAPKGPQPRRKGHSGTPAHRGRHAHPSRGRASAPGRKAARASGLVAVVARAGRGGGGRLHTQLRLARARVADLRLPWERRYDAGRLTPVRVHRVVSSLLAELGTPAKAPKPCDRSPGRPKGRLSGRAKRYPAIKTAA